MAYTLKINGESKSLDVDGDMPLLWAIRDIVGMTGTKFGCGVAQSGACTIYVDGSPTRSCQFRVEDADGVEITTNEGLSGKVASTVQKVCTEMDVPQCGYCQSGQVMAAVALLTENKKPTDSDIDDTLAGNLCRCATYHRIRAGIHEAARQLEAYDMLFSQNNPLKAGGIQADRRQFLVGSAAATGGLLIGFGSPGPVADAATKAATPNPFHAYVQIGSDNKVTIFSSLMDRGQGAYHGLATLVIEELGADWSQIHVTGAAGNAKLYGNLMWGGAAQGTGGSTSTAGSFDRYRIAGAAAREMLVQSAAKSWGVPAEDIKVAKGKISHASGKSASFGELASAAAKLPVPQNVALKKPEEWTEIDDTKRRRFDTAPKTNGTHTFTIDVKLPGMLTTVVAHGPTFGAKVKSFDAAEVISLE